MKKTIQKSFVWALVFWITLFWVVYAANIISVTTQTISTWDSIGAGWYQSVNDKIVNSYTKTEVDTMINEINSKLPVGTQSFPGQSCKDILTSLWNNWDGVYWIKPDSNPAFEVYCDMTTDGWGWTLISTVSSSNLFRSLNTSWNSIESLSLIWNDNTNKLNIDSNMSKSQIESIWANEVLVVSNTQTIKWYSNITIPSVWDYYLRANLHSSSSMQNWITSNVKIKNLKTGLINTARVRPWWNDHYWWSWSENYLHMLIWTQSTWTSWPWLCLHWTCWSESWTIWVRNNDFTSLSTKTSCLDHKNAWRSLDWVYTIDPEANGTWFEVYCDMTRD